MKMKYSLILVGVLVLILMLAGCGAGGAGEEASTAETGSANQAAADADSQGSGGAAQDSEPGSGGAAQDSEPGSGEAAQDGESEAGEAGPGCGDTVSAEEARKLDADTVIIPEEDLDPYFTIEKIDDEVFKRIEGKSFPAGTDEDSGSGQDGGAADARGAGAQISRGDLRYLRVLHVGFDGQTRIGELIVNEKAAKDVRDVFRELYEAGYQIRKMVLVDQYYDVKMKKYEALDRGNQADCVSIEDDNTSAFNYRAASNNSEVLSNHGLGFAIDLNPYENPYVNADGTLDGPDGSAEYMDRSMATEENHMLKDGDIAVTAFRNHGFSWGGNWSGDKDYQHFDYEAE